MDLSGGYYKKSRWFTALFALLTLLYASTTSAGELLSTICRNEVVSVGDRKGEVLAKCGAPLSKAQEAEESQTPQNQQKKKAAKKKVKERADTWTYNIDGSYRFLIFKEGRLARIETGGLAD